MKKVITLSALAYALVPLFAQAAIDESFGSLSGNSMGGCNSSVRSIKDLICLVSSTLASIMPILFVVALLYFLWGAITFIRADDKSRDEARNKILYGIIGLFVMVSVWGLVAVLQGTFGFNNGIVTPPIPRFPTF